MLIINADDFGRSENINKAVIYCFENKLCSSATIMPNMPAFEHACSLAHEKKLLKHIGVHIVLTDGYPLTDAIKRQTRFCNRDGSFAMDKKSRVFYLSSSQRAILADEIRAQITKCRNLGLPVTHIDSHHHIHEEWPVALVLIQVMKEFQIPYLRIMTNLVPAGTIARRVYTAGFNKVLRLLNLAKTDYFGSVQAYLQFKQDNKSLNSSGTFEIMVHPKLNDTGLVIDALSNEPIAGLIKQIDNYEEAQSFSGVCYR